MPITPGQIDFDEKGIPVSPAYGDVYHSDEGGLEQARAVFLQGCDLPNAWQDKSRFVVLETGFGLGLNFLATWQQFRNAPGQCQTLHFISIEKHPLARCDLMRCHALWPELAPLAVSLIEQWPALVAGYHRLGFDHGRVQLTLIFEDAETALRQLDTQANAVYLDGFSPAKNPAIWSAGIMQQLAKLAVPGATLATWCVAGTVRQALQEAGFQIERKPGFARKKERLEARLSAGADAMQTPSSVPKSATLIGSGLAGVTLATALVERGWHVCLIESHPGPAMGASGNPAGVVRPQLTLDESLNGRLSRLAFLHTTALVHSMQPDEAPLPSHDFNGVLHLARDPRQCEHMPAMIEAHAYPENFVRWCSQEEAGRLAGVEVQAPGLFFPHGGWMSGPRIVDRLLRGSAGRLTQQYGVAATRLERTPIGWRVWSGKQLLSDTDIVVLTGAHEAGMFAELPLIAVRGQVTTLPDNSLPGLNIPVTREGYVLPTMHGIGNIGASFGFNEDTTPREKDQLKNIERLGKLLVSPPAINPLAMSARVSFRAATPDRLPLVGAIVDEEQAFPPETPLDRLPRIKGLWVLAGLGARGLTWAPFMGNAMAARLDGEAWWMPRDLWQAIDPARFVLRTTRRKRT